MLDRAYLWFFVRIGLIAVSLFQAWYFVDQMTDDFSKPSWSFLFLMSGLVAAGLLLILGVQAARRGTAYDAWMRPSWFVNPFRCNQPLVLFDTASYFLFGLAVGCALIGMTRTPANWVWELPFSIACGFWLGVRLCMILFPKAVASARASYTAQ